MKCMKCGKETGADWKSLCLSCWKNNKQQQRKGSNKCGHCGKDLSPNEKHSIGSMENGILIFSNWCDYCVNSLYDNT